MKYICVYQSYSNAHVYMLSSLLTTGNSYPDIATKQTNNEWILYNLSICFVFVKLIYYIILVIKK